ncbi:hypothetical protein BKA64DRAFT_670270 [Cadophora sp. MPI-SDFR-AT-0126]|nr:hypothetical protein BKA64DRAFT_670270 [Leotiomycetes sp. MPI-SDFR-AT-0126]
MFEKKSMQPFKLTLSNQAVLTGLQNIPKRSATTPKYLPLVICLHGGTYSAQYFDVDVNHTAAFASNGLEIPVLAINRPGYEDSTSFYPIPEESSYPQEYGSWLHANILPALWAKFGEPNGCNCLVLHCHSLGATGAIIAASKHGKEPQSAKSYPLAGITISGYGTQRQEEAHLPVPPPSHIILPPAAKDSMLLQQGRADPEVYKYTEALNKPMAFEELASMDTVWFPSWRELVAGVRSPVMIGIAGDDGIWEGTKDHLKEFSDAFTGSDRVDGSIVIGAPHNLEMSYWSRGWYARCFGFALECAVAFAMSEQPEKH